MPTQDFTDDFNHAITAPAFYANVFSTPASVGTPTFQYQPASLEVASVGSNIGVRKNIAYSRLWTGFAFRAPAIPGSGAINIIALHPATAGNNELRIELAATGSRFNAYFTTGGFSNGPVYNPGDWVWIEAIADFTGTTYNGYWRIDDVDQTTATLAGQTADTSDYTQMLTYSGGATLTWHAATWRAGQAASISDWLGEPVFKRNHPQLGRSHFGPF